MRNALMGSKNSVLKNNQTVVKRKEKRARTTIFKKLNPFYKKKVFEKPLVKQTENPCVVSCGRSHVELQHNSAGFGHVIKESNVANDNIEVCDQLHSETLYGVKNVKAQPEKRCECESCSQIDGTEKTYGQRIQICERPHRNYPLDKYGSTSGSSVPVPFNCDNDLSDVEIDDPDEFDLIDELFYLIGDSLNIYQHPVTECLTLTLSEEIINYMENNQGLISVGENEFPKQDVLESWLGNSNNKMMSRYDVSDKASSTNPSNLNVAFVKGLIYKQELYGLPTDQTGQAGPSQLQVPVGTEQYVITKHYTYGKDEAQTKTAEQNKPFGCGCAWSWCNDFGMCSSPPTNHLPWGNQPPKNLGKTISATKLDKRDEPKVKSKSLGKVKKKKGPVKQGSVKKVISKKGTGKKQEPATKPLTSQKTNLSKPPKKLAKKKSKTVKQPPTRTDSSESISSENEEELPPKKKKKPERGDKNVGKNKADHVKSKGGSSLNKNLTKNPKSARKRNKTSGNTIKKPNKNKSKSRQSSPSSPVESDDDQLPSTSKSARPIKGKKGGNMDNDNKFSSRTSEKPNIRIGISRPDDSGYDIMFRDKGDMKVKVEQVISGKSRVFTYNSGNEAVITENELKNKEEKAKLTVKRPTEKAKGNGSTIKDLKSQKNKSIKLEVKIPKTMDKTNRSARGKSPEGGIMKASYSGPSSSAKPNRKTSFGQNELSLTHHTGVASEQGSATVIHRTPGASRDSPFTHPSAPAHTEDGHRKDFRRKDTISFDEYVKTTYNESEQQKINPVLLQESLHPIFEKLQSKDGGFPEEPNYTAEVNTDKCIVTGNRIECLTSIPHIKVIFDIPGGHGKKIETVKPIISSAQNDIHVDVGLDRIGPKFLEQINQKGVPFSFMSSENLLAKSESQCRKVEHDEGHPKTHLKIPPIRQSMASVYSLDSAVVPADLLDKKNRLTDQNELNKLKSKPYDANRLLELKECLSKMRLELRNECPCLASRFQDRLENKDKHGRTDRVIIIRTKRREESDECSEESESGSEKEKEDYLHKLADEMLDSKKRSGKKKLANKEEVKTDEVLNEDDNDPKKYEPVIEDETKSERPSQNNKKTTTTTEQPEQQRSFPRIDRDSRSHPEIHRENQSNDEETSLGKKGRRKRRTYDQEVRNRSVLNHPESTVTEDEAVIRRTPRKTIYETVFPKYQSDGRVGFTEVSPGQSSSTYEKPSFRVRSPTGIFYRGQNLLKDTVTYVDSPFASMDGITEINRKGDPSENEIDKTERYDQSREPYSMPAKDGDQTDSQEPKVNLSVGKDSEGKSARDDKKITYNKQINDNKGMDGEYKPLSKRGSILLKPLREPSGGLEESDKNKTRNYNRVNFEKSGSITSDHTDVHMVRPRSSTGIFYEGQNLLKTRMSNDNLQSKSFGEDSENLLIKRGVNNKLKQQKNVSNKVSEPSSVSEELYKKLNRHSSKALIAAASNESNQQRAVMRKSLRGTDDDDVLSHPELSDHSLCLDDPTENEIFRQLREKRKRTMSDKSGRSVWSHPESSVTEYDALMSTKKGKIPPERKQLSKTDLNKPIGLKKTSNLSLVHNAGKESKTNIREEGLKQTLASPKGVDQNLNIDSDENRSQTSSDRQFIQDGKTQKKRYDKIQSSQANNRSNITQPMTTLTKQDLPMTKNLRESSFNRQPLEPKITSDTEKAADKSASEMHEMGSSRVSDDEQEVLLKQSVNEASPSKLGQAGPSESDVQEPAVKRTLYRKEEYERNIKPPSFSDKGKNQGEAVDREIAIQPKSAEAKNDALRAQNAREPIFDQNKPDFSNSDLEQKLVISDDGRFQYVECDEYVFETSQNEIFSQNEVSKRPSMEIKVFQPTSRESGEDLSKINSSRTTDQRMDNTNNELSNVQSSKEKDDSDINLDKAYPSPDRQYHSKYRDTGEKKENGAKEKFSPPYVAMKCCCGTVCPPTSAVDKHQRRSSTQGSR